MNECIDDLCKENSVVARLLTEIIFKIIINKRLVLIMDFIVNR